jgi:hypothetical protein
MPGFCFRISTAGYYLLLQIKSRLPIHFADLSNNRRASVQKRIVLQGC